jgi:anti-sigma factor RsiW
MKCSRVHRLLSAYYDAELTPDLRAAIRRHLQLCEDCRGLVEGFKNLSALMGMWCDVQPPAALGEALALRLQAACETAAQAEVVASWSEQSEKRPHPRRTFKPVLEGLEDRQALSDLFCTSATALAPGPSTSMLAVSHVGAAWSAVQCSMNVAGTF